MADMWLNAFRTIHPSDEFAAEVGREIIKLLVDSNTPERRALRKDDPLIPIYGITVEIVAS